MPHICCLYCVRSSIYSVNLPGMVLTVEVVPTLTQAPPAEAESRQMVEMIVVVVG
jgi:hypothetical protein